eukprot:8059_1
MDVFVVHFTTFILLLLCMLKVSTAHQTIENATLLSLSNLTNASIDGIVFCDSFVSGQLNPSTQSSNYYAFVINDTIDFTFINLCPENYSSEFDTKLYFYNKNKTLLYDSNTSQIIITEALSLKEYFYIIEIEGNPYPDYNQYYMQITCDSISNYTELVQCHSLPCDPSKGGFTCNSGECIPLSAVCNLWTDCDDASDEQIDGCSTKVYVALFWSLIVFMNVIWTLACCRHASNNNSIQHETNVDSNNDNNLTIPLLTAQYVSNNEERKQFQVAQNTKHIKIEFDHHDEDIQAQLAADCCCFGSCCPYIKKSISNSIRSRKATLTDEHFEFTQDVFNYCCCFGCAREQINKKILLNDILNVTVKISDDHKIPELIVTSKNKLSYTPYLQSNPVLLRIAPLTHYQPLQQILLSSIDQTDNEEIVPVVNRNLCGCCCSCSMYYSCIRNSCGAVCVFIRVCCDFKSVVTYYTFCSIIPYLCILLGIIFLCLCVAVILAVISVPLAVFIGIPFIPQYFNVMNINTIWMDRILSMFAFVNAFMLLTSWIYHSTLSDKLQISRLTIQYMTLPLHRTITVELLLITFYLLYHATFMAWNIGNCLFNSFFQYLLQWIWFSVLGPFVISRALTSNLRWYLWYLVPGIIEFILFTTGYVLIEFDIIDHYEYFFPYYELTNNMHCRKRVGVVWSWLNVF